jgi:hypothetical protein
LRADTAKRKGVSIDAATFGYHADVKAGRARGVHPSLDPKGIEVRESRDSDEHPVTVPIIVAKMIQAKLPRLMGCFLDDKASGKRYLGEGYPAILISALDDFDAMCDMNGPSAGTIQVGQFESGMEIDDNLTNLWLTDNGGGTYEESYELLLYFAAEKTVHDHWEKRKRKGYMFLIGDEHPYPMVRGHQVAKVFGDRIQGITLEHVLARVQERYHVFMVIPNMTNHFDDPNLRKFWQNLLGQQNVILLEDPGKICEAIVGAVAICEEHIGIADLKTDGLDVGSALVPLSQAVPAAAGVPGISGLPPVPGGGGGTERL